jgi:NADH-quinone oxidoreductase subunit L
MSHDENRRRFFAYLNLFVAAMLLLVLADNYLLLYVGWEGVGLASYLLIGFWLQQWPLKKLLWQIVWAILVYPLQL